MTLEQITILQRVLTILENEDNITLGLTDIVQTEDYILLESYGDAGYQFYRTIATEFPGLTEIIHDDCDADIIFIKIITD